MEQASRKLLDTALLAGKLLLECGAETERVQDTVERILHAAAGGQAGESYASFVILNGIFIRLAGATTTFVRIDKRDYDLEKVSAVNEVSRGFVEGRFTLEDAHTRLKALDEAPKKQNRPLFYLLAGLLSAGVVMIFGGGWAELPGAVLAGCTTYIAYDLLCRCVDIPFVLEFVSTLLGGLVGAAVALPLGAELSLVLMASIIPLVPGIGVTNAIRDIVSRHYISGMIRFVESLGIAAALGSGTAVALLLVGGGVLAW